MNPSHTGFLSKVFFGQRNDAHLRPQSNVCWNYPSPSTTMKVIKLVSNFDHLFTATNVATNTGFQCSCQGSLTVNKRSVIFKWTVAMCKWTQCRANVSNSFETSENLLISSQNVTSSTQRSSVEMKLLCVAFKGETQGSFKGVICRTKKLKLFKL